MSKIRPPAVAGLFYPADAAQLHSDIQSMLSVVDQSEEAPKALIVPHAGYIFSGPVAASAFAQLKNIRHTVKRVIILGPCHRVPLSGLATSSADYFETPLGSIRIDREAISKITSLPQVKQFDLTHQQEHSLEVPDPALVWQDMSVIKHMMWNTAWKCNYLFCRKSSMTSAWSRLLSEIPALKMSARFLKGFGVAMKP